MSNVNNEFRDDLQKLINKHSIENDSNTPDFVLAQYLIDCLRNWNYTIKFRERSTKGSPAEAVNVPHSRNTYKSEIG